jgi:putative flippase GtrA
MLVVRKLIIYFFKTFLLQRLLQMQLVRYVIAAGTAFVVDVAVYFVLLHFILTTNQYITLLGNVIELRAAMLALLISFTCGLFTNFYMSKLFVFKAKVNNTRRHFARFVGVAIVTFIGNYFLMRFFIEVVNLYPTPARMLSACTFAMCSFAMHKFFSFR